MSFYERLLQETQSERTAFLASPALRLGAEGRVDRGAYQAFLAQAYHHVRHTLPLLMACGARLPARLEWLRTRVAHYIEEETGHQDWILADLAATGADPGAVAGGRPHPATEVMVAYAYDSVQRGNPVSLFGMILVLEGASVALASGAADAIQAALGLPDAAFSYLRSHGALDQDHIRFYADSVDRLGDPGDREAVIHSARMFYRLYGGVFAALPVSDSMSDLKEAA